MPLKDDRQPYIGLIVDFYPNHETRHAAIVTEVHSGSQSPTFRSRVDLIVFKSNGSETWQDVEPVEDTPENDPDLTERWGFAHEFNLEIEDQESTEPNGTKTNTYVGQIGEIT